MIGLFLGTDQPLVSLLAIADDVVGDLEDVDGYSVNLGRVVPCSCLSSRTRPALPGSR